MQQKSKWPFDGLTVTSSQIQNFDQEEAQKKPTEDENDKVDDDEETNNLTSINHTSSSHLTFSSSYNLNYN